MTPFRSLVQAVAMCLADVPSVTRAAALVVAGLSAFAALTAPIAREESDQSSPENVLPSKDKIWSVLRRTHIELDFKRGAYVATYPPDVMALVGQTLTIEGFITPVKAEVAFRHFLLMPYAPGCPFCPPADFNEIVEVTIDKPIRAEERQFRVTGRFATQDNGKDGVFFRLDDATAE